MTKFNQAVSKHVPKSGPKTSKGNISLSSETLKCIRRKHRLWERYMEKGSAESYREFCKARNKVKRQTRNERKAKEWEVAETAKTKCKNFWKYVNSKRKSKTGVSELHTTIDGKLKIASEDSDKAEVLADFFNSEFTIEDNLDMPDIPQAVYDHPSSNEPFTAEEVRKLLLGLNTSKSPGPDKVHPKLLFELASVVDKPLCHIFNCSFTTV